MSLIITSIYWIGWLLGAFLVWWLDKNYMKVLNIKDNHHYLDALVFSTFLWFIAIPLFIYRYYKEY